MDSDSQESSTMEEEESRLASDISEQPMHVGEASLEETRQSEFAERCRRVARNLNLQAVIFIFRMARMRVEGSRML